MDKHSGWNTQFIMLPWQQLSEKWKVRIKLNENLGCRPHLIMIKSLIFKKEISQRKGSYKNPWAIALISLSPKGFWMLPQHPASWVFLLPLTGGWKVAHTQKIPLLGSATETAWNTPKEFDKRTEKKKKAIWNLPKLFFNNSKECLELSPRPDWSKNNTTFSPSDWFSNGIWLLPARKIWREVLMERFEVFLHLRQSHKK